MRALRRWRRASPDLDPRSLEALIARVEHLEDALEGLQDAVYRQALAHDKDVGELRERMKPEEMARALSEDARRRGL